MATVYHNPRSHDHSSEEIIEISCTPCARMGKHIEAENFCDQCCEYMCTSCLQYHDRFGPLRAHTRLGREDIRYKDRPSMEKCSRHEGKHLDMFCADHNEVCCVNCIAIGHRSCTGLLCLQNAAKGIRTSQEYKDVKEGLQKVKKDLEQLIIARKDDIIRVKTERLTVEKSLLGFRMRVKKLLDALEKVTTDQLNDLHQKIDKNIQTDINAMLITKSSIENEIHKSDPSRGNGESKVFVYVKEGNKRQIEGNVLVNDMRKRVGQEKIKFTLNLSIEKHIENVSSLGTFTHQI